MSTDELRRAARRNLKARTDFKVMLTVFAAITLVLLTIWYFSTNGNWPIWPFWPVLVMVLIAVLAGLDAYARRFTTEADIDAEVARMTRRGPASTPRDGGTAQD